MRNKLLIFSYLIFVSHIISGQENNIPIGRWRVHLPYVVMKTLAVGQDKVYTANGSSIFNLDKEDNSVEVNSKYTGLNDVLVSKVGYNDSQDMYIIGYQSGNIDLIKGNVITNASDIIRSVSAGSKKINHILSRNQFAYISGDYGVVLYDLSKKEVKESYLTLTSDFSANPVYASTLNNDSIYLATSKGIMRAKVSPGVNLMDFGSWSTFQKADSIDTLNVVSVCAHGGIVYAAVMNKGIYYYNGSKWRQTTVPMTGGGNIRSLTASGNAILACVDSAVFKITSGSSWTGVYYQNNISPVEAYYDSDNTLWVATSGGGLTQYKNNSYNNIYPNGPLTNIAFRFGYYNNNLVALTGGYNFIAQKVYFENWWCTFENNTSWKVGQFEHPSIPATFSDFVSATYNPANATLYLSSYGDGLIASTLR